MNLFKKRQSKAQQIKIAYDKTFSSPEGRAVLIDLMTSAGVTSPSLDYNNPNPTLMAFNDGAKSIIHRIIEQLNMSPERYLETLEQKTKEEEDFYNED